ncbi:hypothetical protein R6Z07F_005729 [Ovis aries]
MRKGRAVGPARRALAQEEAWALRARWRRRSSLIRQASSPTFQSDPSQSSQNSSQRRVKLELQAGFPVSARTSGAEGNLAEGCLVKGIPGTAGQGLHFSKLEEAGSSGVGAAAEKVRRATRATEPGLKLSSLVRHQASLPSASLQPGVYSTAEEGAATLPPCLDKHEDKNFPVCVMEKNDRRGPNSLH